VSWIENTLAGAVVLVCLALLVRLCLGERRRAQLDARVRLASTELRFAWARLRAGRQGRSQAQHAAQNAIEQAQAKARRRVSKEGNVYSPEAFDQRSPRRDPKKLH
jgi:hypothetical protein